MTTRHLLGTALLALVLNSLAQAQPPLSAGHKQISELINLLGSERFQDRALAQKQLEAIGPPALELLHQAVKTSDLETSRRAADLVRRIEERRDTEEALTPKLVRLDFIDLPVRQAINFLAKESGNPIEIRDNRPDVAERRITLDTGLVPFWKALDMICKEARLCERRPPGGPGGAVFNGNGGAIVIRSFAADSVAVPRGIFLHAEAPLKVHSSLAGSVRFRLFEIPGSKAEDYKLLLEVTPEPRLLSFAVEGMPRIAQALDDQGQERVPKDATAGDADQRQRMFSFYPAVKPAKTLKALTGSVTAWVMGKRQPSITIGDVLQATGKSAKSKNGGLLKVESIKKRPEGDYELRVSLKIHVPEQTRSVLELLANKGATLDASFQRELRSVDLLDAKGAKLQLVDAPFHMADLLKDFTREFTFYFRARAGQGDPESLIVYGSDPVRITVPFAFENIPLE